MSPSPVLSDDVQHRQSEIFMSYTEPLRQSSIAVTTPGWRLDVRPLYLPATLWAGNGAKQMLWGPPGSLVWLGSRGKVTQWKPPSVGELCNVTKTYSPQIHSLLTCHR